MDRILPAASPKTCVAITDAIPLVFLKLVKADHTYIGIINTQVQNNNNKYAHENCPGNILPWLFDIGSKINSLLIAAICKGNSNKPNTKSLQVSDPSGETGLCNDPRKNLPQKIMA